MQDKLASFGRATAGIVLAALAVMIPAAGTASADNGDNGPGCARGELCFWYDTGTRIQKQFWNDANHGGYMFMFYDGYRYEISDQKLQDNARDATNRDTQCGMRVGDLANGLWVWKHVPNDNGRYFLGAVNNRNDRHERCR